MLNEVVELDGSDILVQAVARRRQRPRRTAPDVAGLRFAFYGRMSTEDHQDRVTSSAWQREVAEETIAGQGTIVTEFLDTGCSRRLSWSERPVAAALRHALHDPDRGLEAVVVGEYERAFHGDQFRSVMTPLATARGTAVVA